MMIFNYFWLIRVDWLIDCLIELIIQYWLGDDYDNNNDWWWWLFVFHRLINIIDWLTLIEWLLMMLFDDNKTDKDMMMMITISLFDWFNWLIDWMIDDWYNWLIDIGESEYMFYSCLIWVMVPTTDQILEAINQV